MIQITLITFALIALGVAILSAMYIRHSIKTAREAKDDYCMNLTTYEIHVKGCPRIELIEHKSWMDEWDYKFHEDHSDIVNYCKRCGGGKWAK